MKPYYRWNMFEKKFFWLNNIGIAIMMLGSVLVGFLQINHSIRIEAIVFLITSYAIGRAMLWRKLEALEAEWLRNIQKQEGG